MSYSFTTSPGKAAQVAIVSKQDLSQHTLTVEVSKNKDFQVRSTVGTAVYSNGYVTLSFTASQVDTIGDTYYRIKAVKDAKTAYVTTGTINYTGNDPVDIADDLLDADGYIKDEYLPAGGSVSPTTDSAVGYDLVLLLGQSNMEGGASGTGYDARLDPPGDRVYSFDYSGTYSRQIVSAQDPLIHQGGNLGIGPGLSFGRWYASTLPTSRRVLLVPCSVGGTPLVTTTVDTWNPNVRNSLYDRSIAHARRALGSAGANSRVVAVLWSQGETDANAQVTTAAYAAMLDTLIDRLRNDLGNPSLPFVVGSMVPEFVASVDTRRPVQQALAATPTRRAYTSFVQGPGGFVTADGVHYNADGQRFRGRDFVSGLDVARSNTSAQATVASAAVDTTPQLSVVRHQLTPVYGPGKFGTAMVGGVIGTSAPFAVTATVGTMEAWLRDGGTGWKQAVAIGWRGWIGHDNGGFAGAASVGGLITALGDNNGDGLWHHVAVTHDGSYSRLWIDGKLARRVADTADFLVGGEPLAIGGNYWDSSAAFQGGIDEVRISSSIRYNAPFAPPTEPFQLDRDTVALFHLDG